ncbi:MAG: hypothetical protein ABIG11_00545 [bacterium]
MSLRKINNSLKFAAAFFALTAPSYGADKPRLGFYSGSFDPPTIAHKAIIESACARYSLDKMILFVNKSGSKNYTSSIYERAQMLSLMLPGLKDRTEIINVFSAEKIGYIREHVQSGRYGAVFSFLGEDSFNELPADAHMMAGVVYVVIPRAGAKIAAPASGKVEIMPIQGISEVSSTKVRKKFLRGEMPADLLSEPVLNYINLNHLYSGPPKELEELDNCLYQDSFAYAADAFKTAFPEIDFKEIRLPEYIPAQSPLARTDSFIRAGLKAAETGEHSVSEFEKKARTLLIKNTAAKQYPGIFYISEYVPLDAAEIDDAQKEHKIELPAPADQKNYRMDIRRYTAMRIPPALQNFVRDNRIIPYMQSGDDGQAVSYHKRFGYDKFYRINTPKFQRTMLLAGSSKTGAWRLLLTGIYGNERAEHMKRLLSLFVREAFMVSHRRTALDEFNALISTCSFGVDDAAMIGRGDSFQEAAAARGLNCEEKPGSLGYRLCAKSGFRGILVFLSEIYGDDLRFLLNALYDKGIRKFVYTGTAGGLDNNFKLGDITAPSEYVKNSREKSRIINHMSLCGMEPGKENAPLSTRQAVVDSPLDETVKKLNAMSSAGAQSVDVETAYFQEFTAGHPDAAAAFFAIIADSPLEGDTLDQAAGKIEQLRNSSGKIQTQCLKALGF